jgi:hypothetical protein
MTTFLAILWALIMVGAALPSFSLDRQINRLRGEAKRLGSQPAARNAASWIERS